MSEQSDRFTLESVRASMRDRPFRFFETIGSTQDAARDWALSDPDLPGGQPGDHLAVVLTEEQTAGRGRQGRTWYSPPESSIMFSAILKPTLPPDKLPRVTMAGAVAVTEALLPTLQHRVRLKWPNDILIAGKKAGGVLTESIWEGDRLVAAILGVGLNIRVDFSKLDADNLGGMVTNVEDEFGRSLRRLLLLQLILNRLDHWAAQLDSEQLFETWRGRLETLGQRVTVYPQADAASGASYSGVAESVDEFGALLVRLDDGELRRVVAADVGLTHGDST